MDNELIEEKKRINEEAAALERLFSRLATVRLVVFICAVILIYIGFSKHILLSLIGGLALFFAFAILVGYHGRVQDRIAGIKSKTGVIDKYNQRSTEKWRDFQDNGSEFMTADDNLSRDLDLLGPNSLFQMISIAHTAKGRERLASVLSLKNVDISQVDERYEAVSELAGKLRFLVEFEAASERILEKREKELDRRDDDRDGEVASVSSFPAYFYPLMILVPVINIISIVMVLGYGYNPSLILVTFIIGMIITWGPIGIIQSLASSLERYGSSAKDYHRMLSLIEEESYESSILRAIHDRITSRDGLLDAINRLGTINTINNISYNPIVHMVLAGFLGWDYYIALAASRWNDKNSGVFEECIDIVADIETLGSLAVLSLSRNVSKPVIIDDNRLIMKDIYHPLLSPEEAVANTAELSGDLTIITGSNMSGKTTYMRTIAINMVLSYIGAGVCAESFQLPYMKIFTSMRVMDDVVGGISTFYAEILRIKEMAEYVSGEHSVPAICLIDEIFKGTNSADRIVGAREALQRLSSNNAMVIVTTHDFELCELSDNNYHFEEYYKNGELRFDYRLRDGRCTTRNAMAILEMAGLVQN